MIEGSLFAWLAFLGLVALASGAGVGVSRLIPWRGSARQARFELAFGLALAPFLAGGGILLSLYLFPGANHSVHIACTVVFLLALCFLHAKALRPQDLSRYPPEPRQHCYYLLTSLLVLWMLTLLINAVFIPLTQNDALEYATVGRELFHARSLDAYPVLNPQTNQSGFFGPWTHPPLYVSLIYLTSLLQGHADQPGLMRLLAPWFVLSATLAMVSLGSLRFKNIGLVAGIFFLSTPLLFLGADSALIDALPVSGMVLLLLLLCGCNPDRIAFPCWLGMALGISLWTHSQAIIFIPLVAALLVLKRGLSGWRKTARDLGVMTGVGLLIAAAPYLKNWTLFGSPISDNPLVFALPVLDWAGYFRFARGLDNWPAIIQYGLFKGWFCLEAYGYLFWVGSFGVLLLYWQKLRGQLGVFLRKGCAGTNAATEMLFLNAALMAIYLGGVLLSVLLGIDLMIRNERYILVIVPAVALCAAYGAEGIAHRWLQLFVQDSPPTWRQDLLLFTSWTVGTILLLQLLVVGCYYRWRDVPAKTEHDSFAKPGDEPPPNLLRFKRILQYWSSFRTVIEIADHVLPGSLVLSMRPADMYYSGVKMVSYLDPRLLPVYQEQSPVAAAKMLRELGIHYIHMVDYSLPPLYNSPLQAILADPRLSRLEYGHAGFQIFSLQDSGLQKGPDFDITPGRQHWSRTIQVRLGGRKALDMLGFAYEPFWQNHSTADFSLFHRDYSTTLAYGKGGGFGNTFNRSDTFFPVEEGEYLLHMHLSGRGFIRFFIAQFNAEGYEIKLNAVEQEKPIRIGELTLSEQYPRRIFTRRFHLDPKARYLRIGVEHVGCSSVTIDQASLTKLRIVAPDLLEQP